MNLEQARNIMQSYLTESFGELVYVDNIEVVRSSSGRLWRGQLYSRSSTENMEVGQLIGRSGTDAEPRGEAVFFAVFEDGTPRDPVGWLRPR